jgi:hypothetical protein
MAKRLTATEKRDLFLQNLINKMFEIAGHQITYDDIKDRKDDWYSQWTMTTEQNDEWKKWGIAEIKKQFRYNTLTAEREMGMISLMWGLKFSDFDKK